MPARRARRLSDTAREAPRVRHRISACTVFEPRNAAELSSFHAIARPGLHVPRHDPARHDAVRRGAKHTRGPRVARMRATAAGADVQYARRGATYAP
ncbi:hypothetical protein EGT65_27970 [Burkholderia mallei]|uniref:Uncharacterized protein n=1 Tax=Burkholderia mallei TaxID=13373 RepID=A0AAX1ZWK2_BURML|nr:hypothetical protein [Burkholderia pseudomallei]RUN03916.1 hypothetical protein EGT58_027875 [Burkholderia mallei]NRD87182.1 hypothetical protein [Burkholderia pseudomallei]NRE51707.1 hypothetical protein [Burkholderia pseudomallei]RUN03940.1 hypothetical protein EGT70_30080 [Burkholderia mallei]